MKNKSKEMGLKPSFVQRMSENAQFPWVARGIFFFFAFLLLGGMYGDALLRYFWESYFLYDGEFAKSVIFQPGGLFHYLGRYLNHYFYYPWLGAAVYSLLLVVVQWLCCYLFDCKRRIAMSFIPSTLLLLYLILVSYNIYWRFEPGLIWTPLLGMLYILSVVLLYKKIGDSNLKLVAGMVVSLLLFPSLGCFSLLPMIVVVLQQKDKWKIWLPIIVVGWLVVPLVEKQFYCEYYTTILYEPLCPPFFHTIFALSVFALLSVVLLTVLQRIGWEEKRGLTVALSVVFIVAVFGTFFIPAIRTFRSESKMIRLTDEAEWKEVLETVKDAESITHTQNAFRVIALGQTNQLNKKLFDAPFPLNKFSGGIGVDKIVFAVPLYFYSSFNSLALQMNMEIWTSFGEFNEGLKMFALMALMTDEDNLAKKYIVLMKKSAGLESIAKRYEQYLIDKSLMLKENPHLALVRKHQVSENVEVSVHTSYVNTYFAFDGFSADNVERRLLANLYAKELPNFVSELSYVGPRKYKVLPDYFQEAVVLYAILTQNNSVVKNFPIKQKIGDKVANIIKIIQSKGPDNVDEAKNVLKKKYPNSYTYFYFFESSKTVQKDLK
jgi:hypothetical protein